MYLRQKKAPAGEILPASRLLNLVFVHLNSPLEGYGKKKIQVSTFVKLGLKITELIF